MTCAARCEHAHDIGMTDFHCVNGCMYDLVLSALAAIDIELVQQWRNKQIDEIAAELMGQCVHDVEDLAELRGLGELSAREHDRIDDRAFLCEGCGWWCSIDEFSSNGETCIDCEEDDSDG